MRKTFKGYEFAAKNSDFKFKDSDNLWYVALGINGESGEIADHIKKMFRDDCELTPERRELILKECGDVLWYLTKMSRVLGSSLQEVAELNIKKLTSRKKKGTLRGSGDNR